MSVWWLIDAAVLVVAAAAGRWGRHRLAAEVDRLEARLVRLADLRAAAAELRASASAPPSV